MTHDEAEAIVATIDALVAHRINAARHNARGEYEAYLDDANRAELTRKNLVALIASRSSIEPAPENDPNPGTPPRERP